MKKHPHAYVSRSGQRAVLGCLSALSIISILQVLFFRPQPPLPVLQDSLKDIVQYRESTIVKPNNDSLDKAIRIGESQRYSLDSGGMIIFTPLSAWQLDDLDPGHVNKTLPGIKLISDKSLSIKSSLGDVGVGKIHGKISYQSCLTRSGSLGFDVGLLSNLVRHPDPGFFKKALVAVIPYPSNAYSCVLITTNQRALLDGSNTSTAFIREVNARIVWPR